MAQVLIYPGTIFGGKGTPTWGSSIQFMAFKFTSAIPIYGPPPRWSVGIVNLRDPASSTGAIVPFYQPVGLHFSGDPVEPTSTPPGAAQWTYIPEKASVSIPAYPGAPSGFSPASTSWNSTVPAVATVNASGLVTLVGNGTTVITATMDAVAGAYGATLTVTHATSPIALTVTSTVASFSISNGQIS